MPYNIILDLYICSWLEKVCESKIFCKFYYKELIKAETRPPLCDQVAEIVKDLYC